MTVEQNGKKVKVDLLPVLSGTSRTAGSVQLYIQIYDIFYKLIQSGDIVKGSILPSENALSEHFHVSRGTIRLAMSYLEEDGFITKGQGKRPIVTGGAELSQEGLQTYSDICRTFCQVPVTETCVRWSYYGSGKWVSEQLGIQTGSLLVSATISYYTARHELIALSQRLVPIKYLEQYHINPNNKKEMQNFLTDIIVDTAASSRTEITVKPGQKNGKDFLKQVYYAFSEIVYNAHNEALGHFKSYLSGEYYQLHLKRRTNLMKHSCEGM